MSKLGILVGLFLLVVSVAHAQRIDFTKTFGGMGFEMDTVTLSMNQVLEAMRVNPAAHDEFKLARTYYGASGIIGFTGALLIAVPLVSAVAGGHPEWSLALGGGALILVSIPLNLSFQRHAFNALDTYNREFESGRVRTNLILSATGAKLIIRF